MEESCLGSTYDDMSDEDYIRKQIYEAEEQLDRWNAMALNISEMENTISYQNKNEIERMRELNYRGDRQLQQLWEIKESLLNDISNRSLEFNDLFDRENTNIRNEYENKVNALYEELKGY